MICSIFIKLAIVIVIFQDNYRVNGTRLLSLLLRPQNSMISLLITDKHHALSCLVFGLWRRLLEIVTVLKKCGAWVLILIRSHAMVRIYNTLWDVCNFVITVMQHLLILMIPNGAIVLIVTEHRLILILIFRSRRRNIQLTLIWRIHIFTLLVNTTILHATACHTIIMFKLLPCWHGCWMLLLLAAIATAVDGASSDRLRRIVTRCSPVGGRLAGSRGPPSTAQDLLKTLCRLFCGNRWVGITTAKPAQMIFVV